MDKILEQALLYDFYGELLTAHQKEIYEQFVLDDLSLGGDRGRCGYQPSGCSRYREALCKITGRI